MQRLIIIFSGILFLGTLSCKSQTPSKEQEPEKQQTVFKGVSDQACAIEVAFGSYGAGIDGKSYEKVIAAIDAKKLKYTSKNIGREGETRLCLPLTELKGKKKTDFINQLKKIAKEGQLVSVSIR